jgi:chromosome segregation ATPase
MENKIDQILKIVTMNQQDIAELKRDITELKKDVKELKEDVAILTQEVVELKERVKKLEVELENLKVEVEKLKVRVASLERSVALIEFEHGQKLSALFDAIKVNEDAHERIEKSISNLRSEIQGTLLNHEKRITNLEGNLVPSF